MGQLALTYEPPKPVGMAPLTRAVFELLSNMEWWAPHELVNVLELYGHDLHSDSSITARLRELRNRHGLNIVKRKRRGSRAYEYRLVAGE